MPDECGDKASGKRENEGHFRRSSCARRAAVISTPAITEDAGAGMDNRGSRGTCETSPLQAGEQLQYCGASSPEREFRSKALARILFWEYITCTPGGAEGKLDCFRSLQCKTVVNTQHDDKQ